MAHNWKDNCSLCQDRIFLEHDGLEGFSRCNITSREINYWGQDECPKKELTIKIGYNKKPTKDGL